MADEVETAPQPPTYGGKVAIRNFDGSVDLVAPEDVGKMGPGSRYASDAEVFDEQLGYAAPHMEAAIGAGRGATFGLLDPAAIETARLIGGDENAAIMREALSQSKASHGTASLGGEIVGSLAGMAALPGGSAAEGGSLLLRTARAAPRLFGEGVLMAEGQQLSEDALGDHELVAEKYLTTGLKGGILNVLLGSALHAGGGAIAERLGAKGLAKTEGAAVRALEGGPYRSAGRVAEEAVEARGGRTLEWLREQAEEQAAKGALHSASISGSELSKLGSTADAQSSRVRRIGRALIDEGITDPLASKATQAERLTARVKELGEDLATQRKALDKATARPSAETVLQRIQDEVLVPLTQRSFTEPEQNAIRPFIEEIVTKTKGKPTFESFEELHKLRRDLDAKLKWDKGIPPPTPAVKELREVRRILESEFEAAADRAATELGESTAQKYRLTKQLYSDLKTAEGWATKAAARSAQNRAISLTDTIMAGAALASGNPLGIAAPFANKAIREYGNQAASALLERATKLQHVQQAAATFDSILERGLKNFLAGGGKKGGRAASEAPRVTSEMVSQLRSAATNPSALNQRVADQLAPLRSATPRVAAAASATLLRAGIYAQHVLPKEPPPAGPQLTPSPARPLKPTDLAKAQALVDVLYDPNVVIDALNEGRLSREHVEALKFIQPRIYQNIRLKLRELAVEARPAMTEQQGVGLSVLFQVPMTAQMQPATSRGFQKTYAESAAPMEGGGGGSVSVPQHMGLNRIEAGA